MPLRTYQRSAAISMDVWTQPRCPIIPPVARTLQLQPTCCPAPLQALHLQPLIRLTRTPARAPPAWQLELAPERVVFLMDTQPNRS